MKRNWRTSISALAVSIALLGGGQAVAQDIPPPGAPLPEGDLPLRFSDKLREKGIDFRGIFLGGIGHIADGGLESGTYTGALFGTNVSFDLGKIAGVNGVKVNTGLEWYLLRNPSDGDFGMYAGSSSGSELIPPTEPDVVPYLTNLSLEFALSERTSFEFGKMRIDKMIEKVCGLDFLCFDHIEKQDTGFPSAPSLGALLTYNHTPNLKFSLGAQRVQAPPGHELDNGWDIFNSSEVGENFTAGTAVMASAQYKTDFVSDAYPTLAALDLWHAETTYPPTNVTTKQSGFRLRGRKTLWNATGATASGFPPRAPESVAVFGSIAKEFDDTRKVDLSATLGVSWENPYRGKGWGVTQTNLKVEYAHITDAGLEDQALSRMLNGGVYELGRNDQFHVSWNTTFDVGPGFFVQPSIGYVFNPDSGGYRDAAELPEDGFNYKLMIVKLF